VKESILTFTNPHGFSEFEIGVEDPVATIGDVGYTSFQDAVTDAGNGDTIVVKTGDALSANLTTTKAITVQNGTENDIDVTINGETKTLESGASDSFSYKVPTGGGGGGVTTYAVSVSQADNGTVTVSTKSAAKGATVTLTVSANEGYTLDKLTVTDKDGNAVTVTDAGNGKYTFVMPGSKVDVAAAFAEGTTTEPTVTLPFTDVAESAWYADAVAYVYGKGMMTGTDVTTFAPSITTNRAMIVTILYRLEEEPEAGVSAFTDVAENAYYAQAVAWAAENGIVTGTSETTFDPTSDITREQLAAILYRYAGYKGYDVSNLADLAGYTDAANVSDYAATAMQWANAAGLITGDTETTLSPKGSATRAQVATILMRLCETVAE
jgi:hypothetical protein